MNSSYAQRVSQWKTLFGYRYGKKVNDGKVDRKVINQHDEELRQAFEWISARLANPVGTFVELGVEMGGTCFMYSSFVKPQGIVVPVDMGPYPPAHPVQKVFQALKAEGLNVYPQVTQTSLAIPEVRRICGGRIDLIHIDASHGYNDVKTDWMNYVPMVPKGGIVLAHDTTHRKGVTKWWREVNKGSNFKEILIPNGAGIGCMVKP